jgi:ComF family protein
MLRELLGLFYPRTCIGCHGSLLHAEEFICTYCLYQLPLTHFHRLPENDLEKKFWGRIKILRAYAFLYFRKEGITQKLLHQLKYRGNKELGAYLGKCYASYLKEMEVLPDAVIAVPLHVSKQRKRGYNQSEWFANGISTHLGIDDLSAGVKRITATSTQTKKSRFERWLNVNEVFSVNHPEWFEDKHILICDDVITTGATIEALAKVLPQSCRVSVCSIAVPVL